MVDGTVALYFPFSSQPSVKGMSFAAICKGNRISNNNNLKIFITREV
jgi:hypothetical protein